MARDQQKWEPVLRLIARSVTNLAHDLFGEPVPTSPGHAPTDEFWPLAEILNLRQDEPAGERRVQFRKLARQMSYP